MPNTPSPLPRLLLTLLFLSATAPLCSYAEESEEPKKIDLVQFGMEAFHSNGCQECHSIKKGDKSFKTGPNLYGLFQKQPIMNQVELVNDGIATVKADLEYFRRALMYPNDELSIRDHGQEKGKAYYPVMPKFRWPWDSNNYKAIYQYLLTLNDEENRGPEEVWITLSTHEKQEEEEKYDNQMWVGEDATIARYMTKSGSTRSIHVGLPNQISYTFDTADFTIKRVWSGNFLDVKNERTGRGIGLNKIAKGANDWEIGYLLKPLDKNGETVDLSFKSWPILGFEQREKRRQDVFESKEKPYLEQVKEANAKYLGLDYTNKKRPVLKYKIDDAALNMATTINNSGLVTIAFEAKADRDLAFHINPSVKVVSQSVGSIRENIWTIPKGAVKQFSVQLQLAMTVEPPGNLHKITHDTQPLVIANYDEADLIPAGYSIESVFAPKDRFGRDQLFEPLAIDFAKNGTAVVASRTAGIWKIKDNNWHFYAEGFHDPLGVHIEDDKGEQIVVAHKPELTRVIDKNSDGSADLFETINDDWRLAGDYCEYVHGPVIDDQGNYYFNLNLANAGGKAGGVAMGTFGGYDGWMMRVTPNGELQPWASGLRSPAGIGRGPDNLLLYTDNQGSFVGTSKMHVVQQGDYYGYPASLYDHPDFLGNKAINWQEVNKNAVLPAIHFPHNLAANSPGNPTYDMTAGKFGPFANQILVGDQTLSNISRVDLQQVNGQWQGVVIPFISGLSSGAMRLSFAPDNSLWVGQTGRGWAAKGGEYEALQKITWDGKTTPFEIHTVKLVKEGFVISFTQDIQDKEFDTNSVAVESWKYANTPAYGSPRYFLTEHAPVSVTKHNSNSLVVKLQDLTEDRVVQLKLANVVALNGDQPSNNVAYYTLNTLL